MSLSTDELDSSGIRIPATGSTRPSFRGLLRLRDFRLLWIGQGISVLGDQFHLIALPWLVLRLTGDPLAMGSVMALAGIPRALFMLVGGALTDRFSPRTIMLSSNLLRMLLVTLLAILVLSQMIQLWMIYALALLFGLADAFFFPAQSTIIPQLVEPEQLQAGNSLIQATAHLNMFAGPVLAGTLIALFEGIGGHGDEHGAREMQGIGIAFAVDAFSFLISALTLWMIRIAAEAQPHRLAENEGSVLSAIREGLVSIWHDLPLRTFFFLIAGINFLVAGPFSIGVPVLAKSRFAEGAAAFGVIMSAYSLGALLGMGLAGILPKPEPRRMGPLLLLIISVLGLGLAAIGLIQTTLPAALVTVAMGTANGYVVILFMTWLQQRTPPQLRGRVMSVLMFASVGLLPVSAALAGALIDLNPTALFVGAGALLTAMVLIAATSPSVRSMELPAQTTDT